MALVSASPVRCSTSLRCVSVLLGSLALMAVRPARGESVYRFDDSLLQGSGLAKGSLERFNHAQQVDPGRYVVDVYANTQYVTRTEVSFRLQGDVVEPCLTDQFLRQYLNVRKSDSLTGQSNGCTLLADRLPGASFRYDSARLRLDLSVPQSLLDIKPRGYVDPQEWEAGNTMGFFNYDASLYHSRYEASGNEAADYGYLGLNTGLNIGLWRLRHQSNYSHSRSGSTAVGHWNSVRTSVQRAIVPWRSELTLGEGYTDGNLFGSIGFRGARLVSDDRMLPDSQRQYAPQVRGTAVSNARVVIEQNGRKIYETTVAPGPFVIDDLYGTAYNGDLEVQVISADGSVTRFTVPYAAVPDSIRPGISRYSAIVGEVGQTSAGRGPVAEATYQRGLTNSVSASIGARVSESYLALLAGGVLGTRYGAFGFSSTFSSATVEDRQHKQGWRLGLSYSRTVQPTDTTVNLAGYRYSTQGYRDLGDVLGARLASGRGDVWDSTSFKQRNQLTLLINQGLGRYGNLYLSGSSNDYYDGKSHDIQVQFGYSGTWRQFSYSLAYARQSTTWYRDAVASTLPAFTGGADIRDTVNSTNSLTLTLTLPLGSSRRAPSMSSMMTRRSGDTQGSSLQAGISGTLGPQRDTSYALAASHDSAGGGTHWTSNIQAQTHVATVNGGYSQSSNYQQINAGVRGAAVVHSGGITLGPYVGDTFALVRAKGAHGAIVKGGQGARVNAGGYAIVPSLSPYRYNAVGLDPSGMGDYAELLETERKVAPYSGAAVLMDFKTLVGNALLIKASLPGGGPIPLAAEVVDEEGTTLGMVGQGGLVYARAHADSGRLQIRWGDAADQQCQLPYDVNSANAFDSQGFIHLESTCSSQQDPL